MPGNAIPIREEWDGKRYDKFSGTQYELGMMALEKLAPRDGETILDLGCGNGLVTIKLAERIPRGRVIGLEPSPAMLAQAEENIAARGLSNISLVSLGALEITFHDEFDAVFSNSAIHWVSDLEKAYLLIFDALKPGGRIMIQTSPMELNPLIKTVIAALEDRRYAPYLADRKLPWSFLSVRENEQLIASCGFTHCRIELFHHVYQFGSAAEMKGYLETAPMVPFLSVLPEELKEGFRGSFLERYLQFTKGRNEIVTNRLFISATRPHMKGDES